MKLYFMKSLLLMGLLASVCAQSAQEQIFTVDETMGSIFLHGARYTSLATTNAKPILYRVLDQTESPRHTRVAVVIALGYTGSGIDAANLEKRLRENYVGTLPPDQSGVVESIPWAFAKMASRGVSEAMEVLAKMTSPSYWGQFKFDAFEGVYFQHGLTNEMAMRALVAYAQCGAMDWKERVQAFKDGLSETSAKNVAEWRLDTNRIERAVNEFQVAKAMTVDPKTREMFRKSFNGNLENPGPARIESLSNTNALQYIQGLNISTPSFQPLGVSVLGQLKKEALDAYTHIADSFLNDRYEELAKTLADNGKPLLPLAKLTETAVTTKAAKLKAMTRDMEVTKNILRDVQGKSLSYGDAEGETLSDGTIIVKIPCLGSNETKSRHLPQQQGSRTVDSEDRLIIYMIKQDGHWYWNPFGW